jgi:hypothetical protein
MPDGCLEIPIQEPNFELDERIVMCAEVKTKKKFLTGKNIKRLLPESKVAIEAISKFNLLK